MNNKSDTYTNTDSKLLDFSVWSVNNVTKKYCYNYFKTWNYKGSIKYSCPIMALTNLSNNNEPTKVYTCQLGTGETEKHYSSVFSNSEESK